MFIEIYNAKTGDMTTHELDEPVYQYISQLALYVDLLENEVDYLEEYLKTPILDGEQQRHPN